MSLLEPSYFSCSFVSGFQNTVSCFLLHPQSVTSYHFKTLSWQSCLILCWENRNRNFLRCTCTHLQTWILLSEASAQCVLWIPVTLATSRTLLPELSSLSRVINHALSLGLFPITFKHGVVRMVLSILTSLPWSYHHLSSYCTFLCLLSQQNISISSLPFTGLFNLASVLQSTKTALSKCQRLFLVNSTWPNPVHTFLSTSYFTF